VDLAIVTSATSVSVLLGDGGGGFAAAVNFAAGTAPGPVVSADFNGDGKMDMAEVVYNSLSNTNSVNVFLGDGLGGFTTTSIFLWTSNNVTSIISADFNGDGKVDLVVGSKSFRYVIILLGDGLGGFPSLELFATGGSSSASVTSADFNGDGKVDLAMTDWGAIDVHILLNQTTVNPTTNTAPVFTGTPTIAQTAAGIGTRLIVSGVNATDANGNAVTLSYQWQANGVNITGATAPTYTVQAADAGKAITVVITANDGTQTANATTTATTTAITVDTTPPTITGHNPASNVTNVAVNAAIDITFSEPVTNVTASNFTVTSGGFTVAGTINHNSGNIESFSPASNLANGTTYTVTATTAITDLAGNALTATGGQALSWNFTTTPIVLMGGAMQGNNLALTTAVTTLAGTAGTIGATDGTGAAASFSSPNGITTDGTNLYIADSGNHTIRQIVMATGAVTTLAGTAGTIGSANATAAAASFSSPKSITTDGTNVFVVDTNNHIIRKIQ